MLNQDSRLDSPFSNWHLWYLLAAWIVAAAYVALASSRPQASVGIFILPVVFRLAYSLALASREEFTRDSAHTLWGMIHGMAFAPRHRYHGFQFHST